MKKGQYVIQVRDNAPNPVTSLSGYEPTTEYWPQIIRLANALMIASAVEGYDDKKIVSGANYTITAEIFNDEETHTGVEWAEFTMAINHILWLLHDMNETKQIEYLTPVLKALDTLYYQWRDKALDTLKGAEISDYLRITD